MRGRPVIALTFVLSMVVATTAAEGQSSAVYAPDHHTGSATTLAPEFAAPGAVNQGDVVEFQHSNPLRSPIAPNASYLWSFGDGASAVGVNAQHSYARPGRYTVRLAAVDGGSTVVGISHTIEVQRAPGRAPTGLASRASMAAATSSAGTAGSSEVPTLQVQLLLMPQSLRAALRSGIAARVVSNQAVAGFATVSVPRGDAIRAGIGAGRGLSVVIARGTISRIRVGSADVRFHLSRAVAAKVQKLRAAVLTIHLTLISGSGDRLAIDAAGQY